MAYLKTNWIDGVTPLSATNLNKIEAGVAKGDVVLGTYTGDGAASRTIVLGFRPSAVVLLTKHGYTGNPSSYQGGGLALDGYPIIEIGGGSVLTIVATGFMVYYVSAAKIITNGSIADGWGTSNPFRYIAFR